MERSSRAVFLKGCVFLVCLSWWAVPSQAKQCRNQIPLLGGSTSIYRGAEIDTDEELQEVLANKKYQTAFRQILTKAGLADSYDAIMLEIGNMKADQDIDSYPRGTRFDWMSYRPKGSKSAAILPDSCWDGKEDFRAWTFNFPVEGRDRTFVIPVTCLNLALLKDLPPVCTLTATVACSEEASSITVSATAETDEKTKVASWSLTTNVPGREKESSTEPSPTWTFDVKESESGTYGFKATVKDDKGLESSACSAGVTVCQRVKVVYKTCEQPAVCQLDASGSWPKDWMSPRTAGDLAISIAGSKGDTYDVNVSGPQSFTFQPTNPEGPIHQEITQGGDYKVQLTVKRQDPLCKEAVCSTTVKLQPPPPCCDSPWFLRGFGGFVSAQGSNQEGLLRDGSRQVGNFKLGFNEGLGFGLDLEKRLGAWRENGWGWSFGLFRANLNTIWQLDTPQRWIRDDDRVSMLALTTGPNYHWRQPKWDVFVGPVIGYALFGDATYADNSATPGTFRASFDDSFAFGARAGFDRYFAECWGVTGGLEYLKVSTEADFLDVDVDPLIVKAGFVYHF
jgi:hypothetical protein